MAASTRRPPPLAAAAGADVFVAGSSVFGADDGVLGAMDRLRFTVLPDLARIAQDNGESGNRRPASDRTEQAQCLAGIREESGRDRREQPSR